MAEPVRAEIPHNSPQYQPLRTGTFRVSAGRWLQWAEFGREDGIPVVSFHGAPGSRGEAAMYGPAAHHLGANVLAVSRPGFGKSTPQRRRQIGDFIDDVLEILDARGIDKFGVSGYSAGGPYALAAAARVPDRVVAVNLIAPVAPPAMTGRLPGQNVPFMLGRVLDSQFAKHLPKAHRRLHRFSDAATRELGLPDVSGAAFLESVRAAFTHGPRTVITDWRLTFGAWDFDTSELTNCTIVIWQGKRDLSVPWRGTARLALQLPGARLNLDAKANHFSIFTCHADESIATLVNAYRIQERAQ
ncbi:alpha/beta fold hydrolase [Gulosibacter bifidus]|uniref:Alpha/beta fold hydrolase n=1 Tax=Gulosibacter bifidus TaxID=272239 RepID=A0ABW5RGE1_9MICO|nr:alpha/beta fold hydrolase [Gulosibacter bifidus]